MAEEKTVRVQVPDPSDRTMKMPSLPDEDPAGSSSARSPEKTAFTIFHREAEEDLDALIDRQDRDQRKFPDEKVIRDFPDHLPDLLEQYQLIGGELASGGQASITRARDSSLKRIVALKTLKNTDDDPEQIRRNFIYEAQLTSQLDHPSIIPIYSLSTDMNDRLHLAMKLVKGKTLKERLKQYVDQYEQKRVSPAVERKSLIFRLNQFLNVCAALEYAHARNVIHCDLKPENIMLGEYHETYVMDWGIARRILPDGNAEIIDPPGTISGTPKYISPEAVAGKRIDVRADVFSLGLILFELVTLSRGTVGKENMDVMLNIRDGIMSPVVHRFGIPIDRDLQAIVRKATATDRAQRYQSVHELSEDIRRYLAGLEVSANPDHFCAKILRLMQHHAGAVAVSALSILLLAAMTAGISLFFRYRESEENRRVETLSSQAQTGFSEVVSRIEQTSLSLKNAIEKVAAQAVFLLKHTPEQKGVPVYLDTDSLDRLQPMPADFRFSKRYSFPVSTADFVTHPAPGIPMQRVQSMIDRLYPLRDAFYAAAEGISPADFRKGEWIRNGNPLFIWMYVGFREGVHLGYPGSSGFGRNYDPRERSWYRDAERLTRPAWGNPYIDARNQGLAVPCVIPLREKDGTFLGAAGIDLSVAGLASLIHSKGNSPEYTVGKYLLTLDGDVLIGKENEHRYFMNKENSNAAEELPAYPDRELFQLIRRTRYGRLLREEKGKKYLYLYNKLQSFPGYYLEKIDFNAFDVYGKFRSLK